MYKLVFLFLIIGAQICAPTIIRAADMTCSSGVFSDALYANITSISSDDPEYVIRAWVYDSFSRPETLTRVLQCPEIANATDPTQAIKFDTIRATLSAERTVEINYTTSPQILRDRLTAGEKRELPNNNPSPEIVGDEWINTDPAWYGILITRRGALNDFIGPNKNNTVSLNYIEQNIDAIYPAGIGACTNKSALAMDSAMVNRAAHNTVNIEKDTNDYYVAGDKNLRWISWAQVAADVAITVATVGGGTVILGGLKGARAARAARNVGRTMSELSAIDTVQDYIRASRNLARANDELRAIDRAVDAASYAAKQNEIRAIEATVNQISSGDDVRRFIAAERSSADLLRLTRGLRGLKTAQRGNVIARTFRAVRTAMFSGNRTIARAARVGRAGMKSGRLRDFLFQNTIRMLAQPLATAQTRTGLAYGAIRFIGGMYDWTDTATGEYTSNIRFKPFGLLSADDLEGAENEINYGMWLMWSGDSVSSEDDDAAYLQAMDFAAKFHQDLTELQDDSGDNACDIDIFVVRPILHQSTNQLYYLIMNDTPWSTD